MSSWLKNAKNLKELSLDHNPLTSAGLVFIFAGIESNSAYACSNSAPAKVKSKSLSGPDSSSQQMTGNASPESSSMASLVRRRKLNASPVLVDKVPGVALTILSLSFCQLDAEAGAVIGDAMVDNIVIEQIDLTGNMIGTAGMHHIAIAIEFNTQLQYLRLVQNQIGMPMIENELYSLRLLQRSSPNSPSAFPTTSPINNAAPITTPITLNTTSTMNPVNSVSTKALHPTFQLLVNALEINQTLMHLDIQGNHINDPSLYESFLMVMKSRKSNAAKKIGTPLAITCSERAPSIVFSKLQDLNKTVFTMHKKSQKKGKKKKG